MWAPCFWTGAELACRPLPNIPREEKEIRILLTSKCVDTGLTQS